MKLPIVPEHVLSQVEACRAAGERPTVSSMEKFIHSLCTGSTRIYIILDALDECLQTSEVLESLQRIIPNAPKNLRILAASRNLINIQRIINTINHVEISIGSRIDGILEINNEVDKDIQYYIEKSLASNHYLQIRSEDLKEKIKHILVENSGGMYVRCATMIIKLF